MRRSSCVVLILSFAALGLAGALYLVVPERPAPPMTRAVAVALLKRGEAAFERRDSGALMDIFAPDVPVMGRRPGMLRDAIEHMLREVGPGDIRVDWSAPTISREGPRQMIATDVVVAHKAPKADIIYFRAKLTIDVERRRVPRWGGLLYSQEWRITRIASDPPLGLPDY